VDETAPMRPTNVYEATKADAERAVADAIHSGLPAVIVRPGLVYGPGDLHLLGFFRSILRHQFRPIGRRPIWLHPIYVDDLIEAMMECGRSPAAIGECFHIAGPERVTLTGLAAAIARAQGTFLPRGVIPLAAARTLATVGDLLPPRIRSAAPLTTSRLDFLTHSRVYNVEKAERLLGFRPATDLATGLERSVAWYRAQGYLPAAAAA
jgi:nucleoside-diphosphate-sugar epimerase